MVLRGVYKDSGGIVQFILFVGIIIVGTVAGSVASAFLIALKSGFNAEAINEMMANIAAYPVYLRDMQFLNQLGVFIFPALLTAYLFGENYKDYLYLNTPFYGSTVFWTVLSMIFILPFLNLITQWNRQMVLPDFLKGVEAYIKSMEETGAELTESMLRTTNMQDIIFNILIVAVFAAVGEEFLFRGTLQRIFGSMIRNKHIVIWSAAFIFSFVHFQFYGFIPRLLLGAYFGYLLDFTKCLWIPVIAHFIHNFTGVVLYTVYQEDSAQMERLDALGYGNTWWLSVISLLLFVYAFRQIRKSGSLWDKAEAV
ncbi:MAG: CPBP family intramembrane metalloprotease [Dysgonamonadaceae bacterium]|jgi:membrane protease YdiL (CAAX protease family)|nr:CPBP family intramembrane metalloprotease [Dysgonamonadaceae bacterium]